MISAPDFQKKQIVFVFFSDGEKMSISNDNLVVRGKDGEIKLQISCYRLFMVFAVGNFTITSVVLQRAKKFGFFIACMSAGFRLNSLIGAEKEGNTLLRRKQYLYSGNDIAAQLIRNKILNQRYALMSNRNKSEAVKEAIFQIDKYLSVISPSMELNELMAYEGLAAKLYFKNHFNNVLWNGRKPRLKYDYVNSALDVGYTILFSFIDSLLECYGFDNFVGVMHRQFYMRKSLVCDLVEPFRPLIDIRLKKAINLKQVKQEDFIEVNKQWKLRYECSSKYARLFMEPIIEEKDNIFAYIQKYYYSFMKGVDGGTFPMFLLKEGTH